MLRALICKRRKDFLRIFRREKGESIDSKSFDPKWGYFGNTTEPNIPGRKERERNANSLDTLTMHSL